jgi:hypothetical protein
LRTGGSIGAVRRRRTAAVLTMLLGMPYIAG